MLIKTESVSSGVLSYNIWKALSESPFYPKYSTMYDQVKINAIKVQIQPYMDSGKSSLVLAAAIDRNGISAPITGITQ